jgi:TRAP-type mannitol/chloroaromatic compound transport system permease small subunit
MSASEITVEEVIKITDPGEMNREEQGWADRVVITTGNLIAWLFPALMVAIVIQVIIRKAGHNQAWLDDLQWWLYGVAMVAGFSYAITTNSHVRVDIFHANFNQRKKARIEVFALGWLLLPFVFVLTDVMIHYAYASWLVGETSDSPTGLQGIYMLKMFLVAQLLIATLAAMSALWNNLKKFVQPSLHTYLIAGLPAFIFMAQRLIHYCLWWFIRLTQPDIKPRKIGREALLDNSLWLGFALVFTLIVVSYALSRMRKET